ncbi:tetratricopeptide repeat protein [Mucilaginibacter terrigena]|uniref:Tetratricopeptide repeat protein n=1 Tax=Mucilaginibacter terrigena TaxID=2492395 RepID=A0A4Q5LRY0_9SPHI|nr:tetratricopeptide repeat protein [Mucilaginibacter terrigena]RYU92291.1 tetratricopeptide repeat protein [Mucilaginibacter terrigena]
MEKIENELILEIDKLKDQKQFQKIIDLLPEKLLENYNNATLYALKARAFMKLGKCEEAKNYANKAIELDPLNFMGYLARGNALHLNKAFKEALSDYNIAISLNPNEYLNYYNRATINSLLKNYDNAFEDFEKSINLNPNNALIFYNRALLLQSLNNYQRALEDYNKAISIDKNYYQAYNNRAILLYKLKQSEKAIKDLDKAIDLNPEYKLAYNNRAIIFNKLKKYDKALSDYSEAIRIDKDYASVYFNRAILYKNLGKNIYSLDDYKTYAKLNEFASDSYIKIALSEIKDLEEKISNEWYEKISLIVTNIKKILLFDDGYLTHYTSLSSAKAIILGNSPLRLSEGAYLNDTSEGTELLNFINFQIKNITPENTIEEQFVERPFIGSFVSSKKHNDLTLWRMYGKEIDTEAKGCAITINKNDFINFLEDKLSPEEDEEFHQIDEKFTFYRVAYKAKDKFVVPDISTTNNRRLNKLLVDLKKNVGDLKTVQKDRIAQLLNDITYLFKSAEYQYEQEVRLVVQGVGFEKTIDMLSIPPRVYISLIDIVPVLEKITIGPKVEKSDEWAASFNYHIKKCNRTMYVQKNIGIVISHLPFK